MEDNHLMKLTDIITPGENDVPMGRGGFVNSHPGHRRYIRMVQDRKLEYVKCVKADKMQIAWSIVKELRSLDPPARFLRKDPSTDLWNDVGDKKFREKVSQALREHQPFIKAVIDIDDSVVEAPSTKEVEGSSHDLETILEQPSAAAPMMQFLLPSSTEALPSSTEARRNAFASSRVEASSVPSGEDEPFSPEDIGTNLSEFTVSAGPCFFPASSQLSVEMEDVHQGVIPVPQRLEIDSFASVGLKLSEPDIALLSGLEEGTETERIRWETIRLSRLAGMSDLPRPSLAKRESSYDNEAPGLKRGYIGGAVKRSLLNRDKSDVARQLKESYPPETFQTSTNQDDLDVDTLLVALGKNLIHP